MNYKGALFPFGMAYRGVTGLRNQFYDWGVFRSHDVGAKVVSVGNLTVGGTGKTPVVLALIGLLKEKGITVGVISRGYGRSEKGVLEVDTSAKAAFRFGDEPALIKATYPDVPVIVGESRVPAAQVLMRESKVDIILCDDAFQHRSLRRDLDLVLLDATEPVANYRLLPVGLAREALRPALKRADIVILTKANLLDVDELREREEWLRNQCDKPVVRADYDIKGFTTQGGAPVHDLRDPVYLVSGIAKPQDFERTLEGRVKILKHKSFPDHHRYTNLDVELLLEEASSLGARWVLTTAKDATKLGVFMRLRESLRVAHLDLKVSGNMKDLHAAFDRLVR